MKYQITTSIPMASERKVISKHSTKQEAVKEARRLRGEELFTINLQVETIPEVVWRGWKDK